MSKWVELTLGFYGNNSRYVQREDISLQLTSIPRVRNGVEEITVMYPNGCERGVPTASLGVPRTRVAEGRSDMFVEGEHVTEEHVKRCVEAYGYALDAEIVKLTGLLEDRRAEATIWKVENVKQSGS